MTVNSSEDIRRIYQKWLTFMKFLMIDMRLLRNTNRMTNNQQLIQISHRYSQSHRQIYSLIHFSTYVWIYICECLYAHIMCHSRYIPSKDHYLLRCKEAGKYLSKLKGTKLIWNFSQLTFYLMRLLHKKWSLKWNA